MHLNVLKDGNGIECITRIPDGKCLLLSSGGENPEGILIVTGSHQSNAPKRKSDQ